MADQKTDKPSADKPASEKPLKVKTEVVEIELDRDARAAIDDDAREPRKYSKRNENVQRFERHASRGLHRLAKSVEAGMREWRKATDRSSRKRTDGAIRDALENSARAVGKQIRMASRVPEDAVRAVRTLKVTKALRRLFPL